MSEFTQQFAVGDQVLKASGDYVFQGEVIAAFQKKSGFWRYAVENPDGVIMIMNAKQLGLGK